MTETPTKEKCFVIMPISDPEGYEDGHFKNVYEDILKVAINNAGYSPIRADDVLQTNLIHLNILQELIHSPMAICDLSSRNPNVLFELGLRQAFDMPTVLIQEVGTKPIFDITPMRITNYRKDLIYREVIEDQKKIGEAIKATRDAIGNDRDVNSLIHLLSLTNPAKLDEPGDNNTTQMFQMLMSQINSLKNDFNQIQAYQDKRLEVSNINRKLVLSEYNKARKDLNELKLMVQGGVPEKIIREQANKIQERINLIKTIDDDNLIEASLRIQEVLNKILINYIPERYHSMDS